MYVVMGNPPWSTGQDKAGEGGSKRKNEAIEKRVRETFVAKHKELGLKGGGNATGNLYIQSLRWAADRIVNPSESERENLPDHPSIVAFIHPNSLAEGTSLAGARRSLSEEFTDIYLVNLRGNAYKSGDEFKKEGDKIFGGGSRNGVQITFLVRNPDKHSSGLANVHYLPVPEYSSLQQKWDWLKEIGDVYHPDFEVLPETPLCDWVCLPDDGFDALMPLCSTDKPIPGVSPNIAVGLNSRGVATGCDVWAYSWSREKLEDKICELLDKYLDALDDLNRAYPAPAKPTEDYLKHLMEKHDLAGVSQLKAALKRREPIIFDENRIREVLYRPFVKLWLYEDPRIIQSVKTVSAMFPRNEQSEGIGFTSGSARGTNDSVVAADTLTDLNSLRGGGVRIIRRRRC